MVRRASQLEVDEMLAIGPRPKTKRVDIEPVRGREPLRGCPDQGAGESKYQPFHDL